MVGMVSGGWVVEGWKGGGAGLEKSVTIAINILLLYGRVGPQGWFVATAQCWRLGRPFLVAVLSGLAV